MPQQLGSFEQSGIVGLYNPTIQITILITLSGAILSTRSFKSPLYDLSNGKDSQSLKLAILPLRRALWANQIADLNLTPQIQFLILGSLQKGNDLDFG